MEKPLHVRVAEALGWTDIHAKGTPGCCGDILLIGTRYAGREPGNLMIGGAGVHDPVPDYDTDWCATGPLIERFGLMVHADDRSAAHKEFREENDDILDDSWSSRPIWFSAPTTLVAVCNLILALHQAGKLPSSRSPRPSEPPSPLG